MDDDILARREGDLPHRLPVGIHVEVKADVHSFRDLRGALLRLAYEITTRKDERALLVLVNPGISAAALESEWRMIAQVVLPDIISRLGLAVKKDTRIVPVCGELPIGLADHLSADVGPGQTAYRARVS